MLMGDIMQERNGKELICATDVKYCYEGGKKWEIDN